MVALEIAVVKKRQLVAPASMYSCIVILPVIFAPNGGIEAILAVPDASEIKVKTCPLIANVPKERVNVPNKF